MSLLFPGSLFVALTVSTKFHCSRCGPRSAVRGGSDSLKMICLERTGNCKTFRVQLTTIISQYVDSMQIFQVFLDLYVFAEKTTKSLNNFQIFEKHITYIYIYLLFLILCDCIHRKYIISIEIMMETDIMNKKIKYKTQRFIVKLQNKKTTYGIYLFLLQYDLLSKSIKV